MADYATNSVGTRAKPFSLDYIHGFAREHIAVGFVVSSATFKQLEKRFPPSKKKPSPGGAFGAVTIVVDPEAPANTCEAFYDREAFERRRAAIAPAKGNP